MNVILLFLKKKGPANASYPKISSRLETINPLKLYVYILVLYGIAILVYAFTQRLNKSTSGAVEYIDCTFAEE